ncbi:hypothetical protein HMPREF9141_0020 [Prevotella multiformis DSM 16608]|uniref:Uncharacterized protein n=1 Tax=Prevotella multiformis DSM 16608 TaxID=888743 RepID=F0F354_9BACT|nr:hypothetical protein HMPREF9141_0020 [Prevotella multiformis DSM 16608]
MPGKPALSLCPRVRDGCGHSSGLFSSRRVPVIRDGRSVPDVCAGSSFSVCRIEAGQDSSDP